MQHSDPIREFYEACNRTELYQLCARVGLVTSPAATREKLVSYLLGEEEPPAVEHPMHVWRNGLIGLIQDYWTGIEAQLRCPAKELGPPAQEGEPAKPDPSDYKSPIACYRCVDTRVVSCLVENAPHEGLIQLHRKMTVQPNKDADMTTGVLTLETAPRSMEGMNAGDGVGRGPLKRLYDGLVNDNAAPGDEKSMVAFVDATTEVRRKLVVDYLAVWDQMKGRSGQGNVVPASASPGAPAPTPVVSGTPATGGEPPRTPSNRGKRTPATQTPATSGEEVAGPGGEPSVEEAIRDGLKGMKLILSSITVQLEQLGQAVGGSQVEAARRHDELLRALRGLDQTVKTASAITLWQIAEGPMETPASEVLAQVGTYISILEKALNPGKG